LGLKYRSQRLWTKKRLAWARAKVIERLEGPTDFDWVRDHPDYLPRKPKWMKQARYRKLRKKLVMQALANIDKYPSADRLPLRRFKSRSSLMANSRASGRNRM
jgi:hypothetical protein